MKSTAPRTVLLFKEQLHHWPAVGCTQELGRLQEGLLGLKERALRMPCQHGSRVVLVTSDSILVWPLTLAGKD